MPTAPVPRGDREEVKVINSACDMTVEELFVAYYDCRKSKRNSASALIFEQNLERNLMDLYYELHSGEYRPGRSICFVVEHPKVREVWAAGFRDRVVHHVLYNRIYERFHNRFIHDSYACIPGKGTHKAVARAEYMSRSVTQNFSVPGFVLKMDVANFFVSINKDTLDSLLAKHIPETWWLGLCRAILHHDPVQDCLVKSPSSLMAKVPAHKSLFNSGGRGLPIGNLSSQFFANVYMNELDQYCKHTLKVGRYIRYVDDMLVFGTDSEKLASVPPKVDDFLRKNLSLKLHPNKTSINKVEHGFDAIGYVIRPYARYLRRSTLKNAKAKLRQMCETKQPEHKIRDTANSYLGILKQSNSYRSRKSVSKLLLLQIYGYRSNLSTMVLGAK